MDKPVDSILQQTTDDSEKLAADSLQTFEHLLEDVDFLFHEIKTPLTAIISYAEAMMDQQFPLADQQSFLNIIRKEGLRIDNLLNDFSQTYHQESSTWLAEMSFSKIMVGELLSDAIARFRNVSPRHSIRAEFSPGLPPIRGDREKLYLVLRNLLANAIKFSPKGGDVLVAATEGVEEVTISVSDQGIGIPAECMQDIFDREFRVDLPECQETRGSGLGLAMVKRIVAGHDGHIRVESRQGQGSTFFITLPTYR